LSPLNPRFWNSSADANKDTNIKETIYSKYADFSSLLDNISSDNCHTFTDDMFVGKGVDPVTTVSDDLCCIWILITGFRQSLSAKETSKYTCSTRTAITSCKIRRLDKNTQLTK
jgi:hypothetical protein